MKPDEMNLLNLLGETLDGFAKLPVQHPSDLDEAMIHIHALQYIVIARYTTRELSWLFTMRKSDEDAG